MKRRDLISLMLGVLAALVLACASAPPAPLEQPSATPGNYVIGAGDVLRIVVWKNPEVSGDVPVRPDGMISVPLLDDMPAAGMSPQELKEVITTELSEYISTPDVTVTVIGTDSKRVYVIGEVVRSGPILLSSRLRVLDAITTAGGFSPFADRDDIQVIRYVDGIEQKYEFDYDAYISGKAPGSNILLEAGDTIIVPD